RGAAADLQVDEAVAHAVAPDDLAHHRLERRLAHRPGDAQLAERAAEPLQMRGLVDEIAASDRDHLVNRVGKLEAAILDMDARRTVRDIAAVDISDAGHRRFAWLGRTTGKPVYGEVITKRSRAELGGALAVEYAQRFELAVEGRALHADKGRRARDVAAEARHL